MRELCQRKAQHIVNIKLIMAIHMFLLVFLFLVVIIKNYHHLILLDSDD